MSFFVNQPGGCHNPTYSTRPSALFSTTVYRYVGLCRIHPFYPYSAHAHAHIGEIGLILHNPTSLHTAGMESAHGN